MAGHDEGAGKRCGRKRRGRHGGGKGRHPDLSDAPPEAVIKHVEERVRHRLEHHGLRDQVVVARVDQKVMDGLDQLVEAGIFQSRSEAAAMLLREAILARAGLFENLSEKVSEISALKEGLREMARREFFAAGAESVTEGPAAGESEGGGR